MQITLQSNMILEFENIFIIFAASCVAVPNLATVGKEFSLRIDDNPSVVKTEGETVTLFCKYSSVKDAVLREVVWYRELDDGTSTKLLTYDAVMNISQVSQNLEKKIRGTGPRSIEIYSASTDDDGWYQCHVGVYVNRSIVEKTGYTFLNILVPPKEFRLAVHDVVEGNTLFRHNFSLVCIADQSKPASSIQFLRNGVEIPETDVDYAYNSDGFEKLWGNRTDELSMTKDKSSERSIDLKSGNLQVPIVRNGINRTVSIEYKTVHLKERIEDTKLWRSTGYLLWVLQPDKDLKAEYGCQVNHESFKRTKTVKKVLQPPRTEWLVIEVKPQRPFEGGSVMLEVKRESLQHSFPSPVLLWTNKVSQNQGKKFYVGNRIFVRNLRRNNTEYKVQAFNALGSASSSKTVVLRKRHITSGNQVSSSSFANFSSNGCNERFFIEAVVHVRIFSVALTLFCIWM